MNVQKVARWSTVRVRIPEEHWNEFEAAVLEVARRLGSVNTIAEGMTTGSGHTLGEAYLERGSLTMYAHRTELINARKEEVK